MWRDSSTSTQTLTLCNETGEANKFRQLSVRLPESVRGRGGIDRQVHDWPNGFSLQFQDVLVVPIRCSINQWANPTLGINRARGWYKVLKVLRHGDE